MENYKPEAKYIKNSSKCSMMSVAYANEFL